ETNPGSKAERMGWRGYIHDDSRTVFFWSQKAACTTLFNFIADNMPSRPAQKQYFHANSAPFRGCAEALVTRNYRSVIVVRHPVTRVISAYFNKFCIYRGRPLLCRADLEPFAQDLHDVYCARTGADAQDNSMSFEAFLDTIAHLHASRPRPENLINGHWETQVPAFYKEVGIHYDYVVHVERLDVELSRVARKLGLRHTPRVLNRTRLPETPVEGYLGKLSARQLSGMKFNYENFISPETLATIQGIYDIDFKTLGYPLDPREGFHGTGWAGVLNRTFPALGRLTGR
ncbi:MAG: sulfotransferase family 2 domain-containing protein, partial [Roseovarius sp.]